MTRRFVGVIVGLCAILLACLCVFLVSHHFIRNPWIYSAPAVSAIMNERPILLETMVTPDDRDMGLSGSRRAPRGYAMRFLFDRPAVYPFWMQGMWVPLDIVWVRDGVVVDRVRLDPPRTIFSVPATYVPHEVGDTVYEFAAGEADVYGLNRGTRMRVVY